MSRECPWSVKKVSRTLQGLSGHSLDTPEPGARRASETPVAGRGGCKTHPRNMGFNSEDPTRVVYKRVVWADVLSERKPERGYVRMFPRKENRNEGTFACFPGMKTGTRAHSPKPPFYETALLSPGDQHEAKKHLNTNNFREIRHNRLPSLWPRNKTCENRTCEN